MKQFLSIILREQFTLFYRAGYTFIPFPALIPFEYEIDNNVKDKVIEKFRSVTPFFYDQEYLILHIEKVINNESEFVQFEISDIVAIYPLSEQAKISIESKIDPRILLEKPIFETILPAIEIEIENKEVEKAISALWKICKIENPVENYIANIGLENIFNGLEFRKHGTKANKIQKGNYWEYLIAYDYYQYFPEGIIRHFYQLGEIFSYYKGKTDGIEGTKIEEVLKQIGSGNFEQILQEFNKNTLPQSFIEAMNEIGKSKFNPIIVSVLFLKWKNDLSNQDINLLKSSVFHSGKVAFIDKFPEEVKLALILLGAFFGFRKFYDNYYEALNLRFYKGFKVVEKQAKKDEIEEKIDTIPETNESVKSVIEEEQPKINNEEKQTEITTVEEPIIDDKVKTKTEEKQTEIQSEEKQTEIQSEEKENSVKVGEENNIDLFVRYQKIIDDLLNNQKEVKLTEIKSSIKKHLNETKSVDEIKELILNIKIEVESVQGKTNTIKRIDS